MPNTPGVVFEPSLQALSDFAELLADEVRPLSLGWFRRRLDIDVKADESPVTIADRNVEQALRRRIAEQFPEHGILGEEFGAAHADAEFVWSIDPIDGTRSFISGFPLWGTLLAVTHRGTPVVGVIDMPVQAERWVGRLRQGAWLNGSACRTSDVTRLSDATVYATSPDIFQGAEADAFARLSHAVKTRRFGGDCYCYALLASGHIDLVMEASLQPYDYLALAPVIEAAGGVITDWDGRALTLNSRGRVLAAANAELHRAALAVIGHVAP
ncbi:histidinol-phosphate phosphatase [Pandoraea pneumonica]|jgi:inositol-phosphate phosphatase/L-galactose 1-phosphate phosphatase/histidinol-phosphatase|uniref:Histidinol-phosphatase n=1 Tax=Pandoraea pneumonica TaxID=2508299 RepID=A0A5E4SC93_9BURK|nr:histidinol-phosphatase [Pandoraea pneumonica]VVD73250.1 histidinol-phosphate phosphatase [Pandoraea pneumonica]